MKSGPTSHRFLYACLLVLTGYLVMGNQVGLAACAPWEQLTSGTSSKSARQNALEAIPFQELNQEARNAITPILEKPSIYRRLPITAINVDPDYFVYLVRYPEVIVNIWKIMGVTQMVTSRTEPFRVSTDDGAGTISDVELLYGTSNMHIFLGEGTYEGPVLRRKLKGKCVLILRTEFKKDASGKDIATNSLDVFLKVENATVNLVAKTLNPIFGKTADHNFVESLNFIQRLDETTRKNGPGVQRMANRLTDISNQVRQNFIQMAGIVYERRDVAATAQAPAVDGHRSGYEGSIRRPSRTFEPAPAEGAYYAPPSSMPKWNQGYGRSAPARQASNAYPAQQTTYAPLTTMGGEAGIQTAYPTAAALPPIVKPQSRQMGNPKRAAYQAPRYPQYNFRR